MTFSIVFLIGMGILGMVLLSISAFKKNLEMTGYGFFLLVAAALSLGVLLTT